jgi:glycosyltransferase involved in cell wall biosynthesis
MYDSLEDERWVAPQLPVGHVSSARHSMASIDVIVPNYQYGRFLRECVSSILSQGIADTRVVIIDNASTDDSVAVARRLASEDHRVEVVEHQKNLGHLTSFNEGIDRARADYFMILCSDDMLAPGSLRRAITFMERNDDVHLTFGRELVMGVDGPKRRSAFDTGEGNWQILSGRQLREVLCRTGRPDASRFMVAGTTAIARTTAQKRVGYYRQNLPHTSDLEIWLRFSCVGKAAMTDATQGIRRVHPTNRSASLIDCHAWNLHWESAFDSFFANEGQQLADAKRLRRLAQRALADRAYWGFISNALRGDMRLALKLLGYSLSRRPATLILPPVGYLFQHRDTLERIAGALADAARRWSAAAGVRPIQGSSTDAL